MNPKLGIDVDLHIHGKGKKTAITILNIDFVRNIIHWKYKNEERMRNLCIDTSGSFDLHIIVDGIIEAFEKELPR